MATYSRTLSEVVGGSATGTRDLTALTGVATDPNVTDRQRVPDDPALAGKATATNVSQRPHIAIDPALPAVEVASGARSRSYTKIVSALAGVKVRGQLTSLEYQAMAVIAGTVFDTSGTGLGNATVRVKQPDGTTTGSATTRSNGSYSTAAKSGSTRTFTATDSGYTTDQRPDVSLGATDLTGYDFTLEEMFLVDGTVTDSGGTGIDGASLTASANTVKSGDRSYWETTSDWDTAVSETDVSHPSDVIELAKAAGGETGTVSLSSTVDDGVTASVSFQNSYSNPVVVPYIATRGGGQSLDARAKNVTSSGCDIHMEEPDDQGHATETVCYIVMEAGTSTMDGIKVEAGVHSTSTVIASSGGSFDTISFNQTWNDPPVVLHGLTTYNNGEFMATAAKNVSTSSFDLAQEAAETGHETNATTEDIAWIALGETDATADGFDDGDVAEWTVNDLTAVTNRVYSGSHAAYCGTAQSGQPQATRTFWSGGKQISQFSFVWQETSNSNGAGVRFKNSNGNYELGCADDNPQWDIDDGNGITQVYGGDGYNRWIRYTVQFDWSNGTFGVEFEDLLTGSRFSDTGRPLKNGVDIETIEIWDYNSGTWGGGAIDTWFDHFCEGHTTVNGTAIDAAARSDGDNDGVDNAPHTAGFAAEFANTPDVITKTQTRNGGDGGWARAAGTQWDTSGHETYVEEDQIGDSERGHTDETFGYVATDSGASLGSGSYKSSGSLTAATKTFSDPVKPDLTNLRYNLNGESIDVTVIGSPGTASEEQVTQSLGGADQYDLSWSNSHTDFRVKVALSTTTSSTTPTFSSVELKY